MTAAPARSVRQPARTHTLAIPRPLARSLALFLALATLPAVPRAQDAVSKVHPWKQAYARRVAESGAEVREEKEHRKAKIEASLQEWRELQRARRKAEAERARKQGGERARPARPEGPTTEPEMALPYDGVTPRPRVAGRFGARDFVTPANVIVNERLGDSPSSGQSETSIAAFGDVVVAAWNDGQGFFTTGDTQGWGVSLDGGQTWSDGGTFPKPPGVPNFTWTSDPVLTVNEKTGAFYFSALCDFGPTPQPFPDSNGVAVIKGRRNGSTIAWGTPAIARRVSYSDDFLDKEWIVADSSTGRVHLSYTRFPFAGSQISAQWADSNATSWSSPVLISLNTVEENGFVQGSRPVVDGEGRVYVVYELIGQSFEDFYRIARSNNGGVSFTQPVTAVTMYTNFGTGSPGFNRERGIEFCGIAVDRSHGPERGRVYLSWAESINWLDEVLTLGTGGNKSEVEPNGNGGSATPATLGQTLRGTISSTGDADHFSLPLTAGQHVVIAADSSSTSVGDLVSLRMVAGDGITRLTFTTFNSDVNPGPGFPNGLPSGWMFTAPVTGTYFIRVGSFDGSTGSYRVRTGEVHRDDSERGRDQRDIFTASSPDGLTWTAPVRVNEDAVGLDNFLPEVAVGPDGGVYCAWYDYRDAAPAKNGGEASVYLARSGDAGATWTTLGALADSLSDWTAAATNILPNQGDYLALLTSTAYVWGFWSDARRGDPDVFLARTPLIPLGAQVTFEDVQLGNEFITMEWSTQPPDTLTMRLYRSTDGGPFVFLDVVQFNAAGALTYTDTTVTFNHGYSYRLGKFTGGVELFYGQVSVFLPASFPLSIQRPRPNPVTGSSFVVSLSLATNDPADLILHDIAGREMLRRTVNLGMGPHTVSLPVPSSFHQGLYVLTVRQGGRNSSTRVNLVR